MDQNTDQVHSDLQALIEAAANDDALERNLRMATTAGAIIAALLTAFHICELVHCGAKRGWKRPSC